jgi:cell wall assembly regulator SMI1
MWGYLIIEYRDYNDNVKRLRNSPVMSQLHEHPDWLPLIFDEKGNSKPLPRPEEPRLWLSANQ